LKFIHTIAAAGLAAAAFVTPSSALDISGAGASFPYPVYTKWADAYKKETGVGLNYQSIGSGGGIKQIKAKTVAFGATDAPLKGEELEKDGLVQFPAVMGGIVPVVNITASSLANWSSTVQPLPRFSSARSSRGMTRPSPSSMRARSCRNRRLPSCIVRTARAPPSTSRIISPK
jgi:phosphate transport system substrate-binding protein